MDQSLALAPIQSLYISPVVDVQGAVDRYNAVNGFISSILKEGTDYGKVPGSDKDTLLKPGAEKLASFFGLSPRFILADKVEDWTGENHGGEPFFYYRYKCQLFRGDYLIAEGEGSCNSWEKKYRYRWMNEMDIPANVDKARLEYKDGAISEFSFAIEKAETSGKYGKPAAYWQQFKDAIANGTARKFKKKAKDKEYDAYEIGGKLYAVPNRDVADQVNTIQKMSQKRSLIAPVLIATNASERFTQDVEDFQDVSTPHMEVFDGEFEPIQQTTQPPAPVQPIAPPPTAHPAPKTEAKPTRPYDPETLKAGIVQRAKNLGSYTATDKQIGLLASMLDKCFAGETNSSDMRHAVQEYLTGKKSSKDMPGEYVKVMLDWLDAKQDNGGDYTPSAMAVKEAQAIRRQSLIDAGQGDLFETIPADAG